VQRCAVCAKVAGTRRNGDMPRICVHLDRLLAFVNGMMLFFSQLKITPRVEQHEQAHRVCVVPLKAVVHQALQALISFKNASIRDV
jgi:hypothetical protein